MIADWGFLIFEGSENQQSTILNSQFSIFRKGLGHDFSNVGGAGLDIGGPGRGVAGLHLPLVEEAVGGVEGEVVPDLVVV
jgi:hypothetical protein